jgi:hypothetical protein
MSGIPGAPLAFTIFTATSTAQRAQLSEVKEIEGNKELRGMSLSLFLDPLLINFPCSLLAQALAIVRNVK